jgi:hypothetical protein
MEFEIPRSTATFAVFHPRNEKNKGMACDIPFRITIDCKYLPMLAPPQLMDGETDNPDSFINEFWTPEGYVRRPHLSPMEIHRWPEGVSVQIFDEQAEKKKGALKLEGCTLNKLKVEMRSPHQIVLSGQIQYAKYNDKELVRINALSAKTFDLQMAIPQSDLFEAKDDKNSGPKDPEAAEKGSNVADIAEERERRASGAEADEEQQDPEE